MTVSVTSTPDLPSRLVNGILSIQPLANLAKHQARQMMIKRAERIGVFWTQEVEKLRSRDWSTDLAQVQNSQLTYPDYYVTSFHAYETGNLSWQAAFEVEPAAHAVHAKIWQDTEAQGDAKLRQSYHKILESSISQPPQDILDLGCSVGMSTFALQAAYPQAKITGLDLSPYFLAVANYRSQQHQATINWVHAQAETTGLADASYDLVSIFLMCHELPQSATQKIFAEARRVLRPGGHLAIMDMNPKSEIYKKMPTYILTLLKSTEPYLDEYFSLDIEQALVKAGFQTPTITSNSPRHRTVIAQVCG
ncbi:class I SAM-dependent methyltransferase [Anabaena cylindrica FACHB-243]|uniref:Methyltransferase type 11 n=1 Tax=Anabaena cylindrica (strain ATCC 27899 / PCC 7122) TaxID=272123 RepID=K9ZI06_ANACC|nr:MULTISPECIES: class I SAM-dependent methyltransferase [Anabaena]AFZ58868.1 Methyltransferase type 11 [Anabaena cylindrica PCC 7122]MBD2419453.1 class I SAM-dependent methyltransferase [Anabaena cylindrica FACHB-243]MBY5283800.1 class I SAM-dependent methyltransferase [Anabaena sp. CCAP 1446/1C]MBY5306206.1 class I SAM-dependent methyltransferase [Anabaena sp. CCAP 1446/1C]MCM2408364.1 class I SAM-dependent methyltransferase [Anabaena sp. CCAP 1446/1C]